MNDETPKPRAPSERSLSQFLVCMVAGVIAGIVVGVFTVGFGLIMDCRDSHMTIADFVKSGRAFQDAEVFLVIIFVSGPIFGVIGGLITALFSRRTRHPVVLASVWASAL